MPETEDIWTDTIDEQEEPTEPASPDPIESLKAEYETLRSQLPSEEDREILSALKGLRQPKEAAPDESEVKLQEAIKLLAGKGVITQDNPEVKALLGFVDELKAERAESLNKALQDEGFKSPQGLEAKLTLLYHEEFNESEKKEISKLLTPYFDDNGMKNPVKIAQTLKAFMARREGSELPSKSIDTSIKGTASGTQGKGKPTRHEFFSQIHPKMTEEQLARMHASKQKPYID